MSAHGKTDPGLHVPGREVPVLFTDVKPADMSTEDRARSRRAFLRWWAGYDSPAPASAGCYTRETAADAWMAACAWKERERER